MSSRSLILAFLTLCTSVSLGTAQTRKLVGRVSDARTGLPISEGEVSVRGGVARDLLRPDGVFVFTIPQEEVSLVVEAAGYRTVAVSVPSGQEVVFVKLQPDAIALEGVVVGSERGTLLRPGSAALLGEVGGGELTTVPVTGVKQALIGRTATADVRLNSGVPGGDVHLTVRGVATILGRSTPIYVVDGVLVSDISIASGLSSVIDGQLPMSGRIVDLNVHDIERLEVLSGIAATTIYGSIGSRGVVVIQTKRGR